MNLLANLKPLIVHTEPQAKMFMRLDKESGIKRAWKVGDRYWQVYHGEGMTRLSVLCAVVFVGIGAFGMWAYSPALRPVPRGTPDVVCYENPDSDLRAGRWKRMYEAERQNVSFLVSKRRAEFREDQSLVCYEYASGTSPQRFIAKQQWWRPK